MSHKSDSSYALFANPQLYFSISIYDDNLMLQMMIAKSVRKKQQKNLRTTKKILLEYDQVSNLVQLVLFVVSIN